jgi:hypothetical protein
MAHRQRESKQRGELADASPQYQDVTAEVSFTALAISKSHDRGRWLPHAPARRRSRNAACGREPKVAGVLDEVAEAMVVALLPAGADIPHDP